MRRLRLAENLHCNLTSKYRRTHEHTHTHKPTNFPLPLLINLPGLFSSLPSALRFIFHRHHHRTTTIVTTHHYRDLSYHHWKTYSWNIYNASYNIAALMPSSTFLLWEYFAAFAAFVIPFSSLFSLPFHLQFISASRHKRISLCMLHHRWFRYLWVVLKKEKKELSAAEHPVLQWITHSTHHCFTNQ